ncbi:MAG: site-specific DNA-methyltransferase [Chloroherpetonaceae bacterium]|nr:site-specific DNA-methyltransferase [Chloroherpetonaceae bacterium]MDW8436806.1 site-specific DNA-methyltransferase [Chloroherpetonaceae bacterium]
MKREIILGDCVSELKKIEDETIDLVIADPPYWKVVGESWDYEWRTERDYVEWSVQWISEASRALRKGGTLYLFGYFRNLALLVPHLERCGLELRQQIVIDKGIKAVAGRATRDYKLFPNVTESILFVIKDSKPFIKRFLKERQKELGLTAREINERLGVKSNGGGMWSIYTGDNVCEQIPTAELWSKLQEILRFDLPYEAIAQTFNPQMGITDVWRDIDFYQEKRLHPTQKPLPLIKRLIQASSNPNDLVLDPFAGSGTTAIACLQLNRQFIVVEKDEKYCSLIRERVDDYLNPLKHLASVADTAS